MRRPSRQPSPKDLSSRVSQRFDYDEMTLHSDVQWCTLLLPENRVQFLRELRHLHQAAARRALSIVRLKVYHESSRMTQTPPAAAPPLLAAGPQSATTCCRAADITCC